MKTVAPVFKTGLKAKAGKWFTEKARAIRYKKNNECDFLNFTNFKICVLKLKIELVSEQLKFFFEPNKSNKFK